MTLDICKLKETKGSNPNENMQLNLCHGLGHGPAHTIPTPNSEKTKSKKENQTFTKPSFSSCNPSLSPPPWNLPLPSLLSCNLLQHPPSLSYSNILSATISLSGTCASLLRLLLLTLSKTLIF